MISPDVPPPASTEQLLHDLRVHQVELQLQNEELRRAQLELDAARVRWFDLYDMAPVGYCTLTRRGMLHQANLTISTMVGVPRSALEHQPFSHLIAESSRDTWYRLYEEISRDGEPRSYELEMLRVDAPSWFAQLSVTIASDGTGADELRIALVDITARRDAERQAEASRSLLDAIIDSTPSWIFAMDRGQRFTLVNAALERERGMTKATLLGRTESELYAPDVAASIREVNARIMETGEAESREEVIHGAGHLKSRTVVASRFPLRDSRGAVTGLAAVVTDVTAHRIAEAERARLAEQVQQMQKMDSIGRLAGGIAHDFNNQLGVILGHAELALLRLDASRPEYEELTEIRDASLRSSNLTRQLLSFARRQPIQPTVLDLNDTVAHVLTMLRRLIGENISLHWRPGPKLWRVTMDGVQVEQILANLAVNARDAIAGHGTIAVATANVTLDAAWCATRPEATPGDYVRLSISDDGCGMSPDVVAQIFEPFYTTKGVGEGTGLGLASVYGAVRQNDGFITVDSTVGKGTTFAIHFRRTHQAWGGAVAAAETPPLARGDETILLVEDEGAVRRLATRVLQRQGYTVLAADSPTHALRLARQHGDTIALLVSDVVMPGMEGPVLADALHALHPGLRYLFMSGYSVNDSSDTGPPQDAAHFISKPFTVAALAAKVREVLDHG